MKSPQSDPKRAGGTTPFGGGARRAYRRPGILYREPLEAMAAVCTPSPPAKGNPGFCPQGPISS